MRRALSSTLALFLAAGIGFAAPALLEPEPVANPWAPATGAPVEADRDDETDRDRLAADMIATLTAVRAGTMPSSEPPSGAGALLVATPDSTIERTASCSAS